MDDSSNERAIVPEILRPKNLTKGVERSKKEMLKYLDKEAIAEGIDRIHDSQEKMFITFLWMSGVRVTEAINIKRGDLDFQNKTIRIRWLKSRKYTERNIPIHSTLVLMLGIYTGAMNREDRIFSFTRQRAFQITQKWFKVSPHCFRHSFAVNYLRSGGNIVNLSRLLGHARIQTTMEYLKIVPSDLAKELEGIKF